MKRLFVKFRYVVLLLVAVVCFGFMFVNRRPDSEMEYVRLMVAANNDYKVQFTFDQYESLLQKLTQARFKVLPLELFRQHYDPDKILVGLRHDVDLQPFTAVKMAELEKKYDLPATYYILHSAFYYGTIENRDVTRRPCMDRIYKQIYKLGHEIGVHNDLMTLTVSGIDPLAFQKQELEYYRDLGIPITGSCAHGYPLFKQIGLPNFSMFSDFCSSGSFNFANQSYNYGEYSLGEFGFEYEAYHIDHNIFIRDSGGGLTWVLFRMC